MTEAFELCGTVNIFDFKVQERKLYWRTATTLYTVSCFWKSQLWYNIIWYSPAQIKSTAIFLSKNFHLIKYFDYTDALILNNFWCQQQKTAQLSSSYKKLFMWHTNWVKSFAYIKKKMMNPPSSTFHTILCKLHNPWDISSWIPNPWQIVLSRRAQRHIT